MNKLGDLYTDFTRIDLDARGGYARVAQAKMRRQAAHSDKCAFKLMRHELVDPQKGLRRFSHEFSLLVEITKKPNFPSAVTKIYDSGFVPVEFSYSLQNLTNYTILNPTPDLDIVSTGVDIQNYLDKQLELENNEPGRWLPYLAVELASYDDSLLRQINQPLEDVPSDFDRLPTITIITMALQLLEVIEYLHKQHSLAYIDWKPEHIYWNVQKQDLKLIDWNVTHRLDDEPGEKQNIRDDLRLFCGAALYCSLALNDPEDLVTPIGPAPKVIPEQISIEHYRYLTDNPNFYRREDVLDKQIKQLVKKGLDPTQGFDTPEEFRYALMEFAEQNLDLPIKKLLLNQEIDEQTLSANELLILADDAYFSAEYDQAIKLYQQLLKSDPNNVRAKERISLSNQNRMAADSVKDLPRFARRHYRQARSYVSGGDFEFAIQSLIFAIGFAKGKGLDYPDAESLLSKLILDKIERKPKDKKWDEYLETVIKALAVESDDGDIKKVGDGIDKLLKEQIKLRQLGILKIFASLGGLREALNSARAIFGSENLLLKFIERQLNQIRLTRLVSMVTFLLIGSYIFYPKLLPFPSVTPTQSSTNNVPIISDTPTGTPTMTASATNSVTPTETPTSTQAPVPTPISVLGYGRLTTNFFPVETPNGKRIQHLINGKESDLMLGPKQFVTVLDSEFGVGGIWYKCAWDLYGVEGVGWILEGNIEFVPPPTPTLSITQTP